MEVAFTMSKPSRIALVFAALLSVAIAPLASKAAPAKKPSTPAVQFAPAVVVDPMRLGGEPIMVTDSKHNIYISSILGAANNTSLLWKSEDGGESFDLLRAAPDQPQVVSRPTLTAGGGDSALIVGPPKAGMKDDTIMLIDLESLASFGTGVSFDGGNTFTNHNPYASGDQPIGDRQWGAHWRDPQGVDHYYNFFNGLLNPKGAADPAPDVANDSLGGAEFGYAIIETDNYGQTWKDWKRGVVTNPANGRPGPLFVDKKSGDLFLTWTLSEGNTGGAGFTRCTQQKVCTDTVIAKMPNHDTNNTFVTGARDRAGNFYVAWSAIPRGALNPATNPTRIYMSSSRNNGKTWTKPVVASGSLPTASMPTIVAGDAGRISVVYYGTPKKGDPNDNAGPWYVYMSQSLNALSAKPTFTVSNVSGHTNHINPICTKGTICAADPQRRDDRNLIDFLYAAIGPRGETMVTWADTANQLGSNPPKGPAFTMFGKQIAGPSLYARPGLVDTPRTGLLEYSRRANQIGRVIPRNWRADARDARFPRHAPGGPGPENPSMDITSAYLEPGAAGMMRGVINLHDTFNVIVPSPYANNLYMLWWWAENKIQYAAAEVGPAGAGVSGSEDPISDCYAGEPGYSNPASFRWATYAATSVPPPSVTRIDCSLNLLTGKLTFNIPLAAVDATVGQTLHSVTASSYAIFQPSIVVNAISILPEEVDQTSPWTYRVGSRREQTVLPAPKKRR